MRIRILALIACLLSAFSPISPLLADEIVPVSLPAATPAPTGTPEGSATPAASPAVNGTVPATVIPFEKLLPLLPAAPEGWTAQTPQGSTSETDEIKLTTVERSYFKGNEENAPTASVSILDFAGNQGYFEAATGAWKFSSETTEGYDKAVNLDGIPAFEHYAKADKTGSLSAVVAKRFFIQIELTNLDPKELRDWFKKIDLKKLAELK